MNSEGANTPPEPPIHIVRLVARIFADEQPEQREDDVVARDRALQDRVANAVHLRHREQQQAEQDARRRRVAAIRGRARAGRRGPRRHRAPA